MTGEYFPQTPYLKEKAIEDMGILTRSNLRKKRWNGDGPPYLKVGREVLYPTKELFAWLEARKCRSTSDDAYLKLKPTGFGRADHPMHQLRKGKRGETV